MGNVNQKFTEFLQQNSIELSEQERHKYDDWCNEGEVNSSSWLGWIYSALFKAPLQHKSLWCGILGIFKSNSDWEEHYAFPAFVKDQKRFDQLSNYYGNLYRGSFVFNYFMGAMAVFAALVPVGFSFNEHFAEHQAHVYGSIATGVELVIILTILLIYKVGETKHSGSTHGVGLFGRRWHERWLEYRLLAERFRYMGILYPLGIDPLKDGAAHAQQGWSWMNAYLAHRLSEVKTTPIADIGAYKKVLNDIMAGQMNYHEGNRHKMERIHHRLHSYASWMFFGTLLACLSHFVFHHMMLTLLAGFLPALAAAMHGILASGEFVKTADVSEQMSRQIGTLIERLATTKSEGEIREVAIDFHNIVIKDVIGWKAIFMDKNVPLA